MPILPTVELVDTDGNVFIANESDFNDGVYPDCELFDPEAEETNDDAPQYHKMNKAGLQDECVAREIEYTESNTKSELITLLTVADER